MSDTQVVLYLLALLSIYALAAKLDEPAALPVHRPLAQPAHARCVHQAQLRAARSMDAASASGQAAQPSRLTC
ncbi:MAG: hypothetical protein E6Q93_25880 [Burkholderiaceae bacterium]|nr:MAG: hypothetical protein E6Q93_25880 [Burkholderiaceae bacterium]